MMHKPRLFKLHNKKQRSQPRSITGSSFLLSVALLCGCAVGPTYEKPELKLAETFSDTQKDQALQQGVILDVASERWWESFSDETLNRWVTQGLDRNLDIAMAVERISAAQATLNGTGINAAVSGSLSAESTRSGADGISASTSDSVSLSGNLALDLFGGIRRERQAAAASFYAAIDDSQTARLAYLSALVSAYINARYYQYAVTLTEQSIASRQKTLDITQRQRSVGSATELGEAQVRALLYTAKADVPDLEAGYLAQIYAMATLLDVPASGLLQEMARTEPTEKELLGLTLVTPYETGVPADLLRNRPDVRSAEQSLRAAVANVGVAEAARLPSLSLSGTITSNDDSWSFGPILSLPIFNQGALKANLDQSASAAREAALQYRQTVLEAVEDVQSANSAWLRDRKKVDWLQQAVTSYDRSLELSLATYQAGVMTLLDLLDTDRSLASARLQYAAALRDLSVDWATLQIALGAGAQPE